MSQKINEKAKMIQDAFGVSANHVDSVGNKMAEICAMAQEGHEPSGFIANKIRETFSKEDLEIIATMLAIKVINEENEKMGCDCAGCKADRGEEISEEEIMVALQNSLNERFPGMEAHVIRVPKETKGKTNC